MSPLLVRDPRTGLLVPYKPRRVPLTRVEFALRVFAFDVRRRGWRVACRWLRERLTGRLSYPPS